MDDGTAYLARAVSYTCKIIMKLSTGSGSQNFLFIHRHSKGPGSVFTTLNFVRNLQIGPIRCSVILH
jgi:hypothetical protein